MTTHDVPIAEITSENPANYRVAFAKRSEPFWQRYLLFGYAAIALPFAIWRITAVNWLFIGGPLMLAADFYGVTTGLLHLWMIRDVYYPIHRPWRGRAKVDIFVPTYNEPPSILGPVLKGAVGVRGHGHVWVLDDGNRPWVSELATHLGINYLPRTTNLHAKAGNLNNGLAHSKADFILTLDADHIPQAHFLERTMGYFDDSRIGFVQTPQTFYNTHSFLFRRSHRGKLWSEQKMFYDVIQPAKNRWNSAFFVGTSAVLRRSALDSIGGFATGTATEDIHTSLKLHAARWQSIFVPEALAYGLEAESLKEFYKQRRRWAAGSLGLLFRSPDSPLRARGLTFQQRLNYLSATLAHLQGVQKLFYILTPILSLALLTSPVHLSSQYYGLMVWANVVTGITIAAIYARGSYHFIHSESYHAASLLAHFGGLWGIIKVQRKFAVSRKIVAPGERTYLKALLWALVFVSVAAITRGVLLMVRGSGSGLVTTSVLFTALNTTYLLSFLIYLGRYEKRAPITDIPSYAQPTPLLQPVRELQPQLAYAASESID